VIPLGILAAAGGAVAAAGSYDLLATEILTSSQSSVTFASLGSYSANYEHLQLRVSARQQTPGALATVAFRVQFNSDTTAGNYANHGLFGNGSSVTSYAATNNNQIGSITTQNATSDSYSATVIDLLDAFSSSKYTTARSLSGAAGTNPDVVLRSVLWKSTSSITSITLDGYGDNLLAKSRFSLYGIRKAA